MNSVINWLVALSLTFQWLASTVCAPAMRKTESIEAVQEANMADCADPTADSPLVSLEHKELAERLSGTLSELKPPQGAVLTDFFLQGLSYEGIARKHGIPIGSVGVYLKRGLETLRRIWGQRAES